MINLDDVKQAQDQWAQGIIAIGQAYLSQQDHTTVAADLIQALYAYDLDEQKVLFKPTQAKSIPFRKTHEAALSYFVGNNPNFPEDQGFALKPWAKVVFNNDEVIIQHDMAFAMGHYLITDSEGNTITVEYTFGYIQGALGQLKIILHHSSMPWTG